MPARDVGTERNAMSDRKRERLGILGGMGPQATQMLYQWILDRTDASCDQEHIPTLILSDTQVPDRTGAILSGQGEKVYKHLLEDARLLENSGCRCIAIPCNTSHYFAEDMQKELSIPIIHMPRETVRRLAEEGRKKAALLATDGTVQTGVYHREAERFGIEIWSPEPDIQKVVMSIIYDEIKQGKRGDAEQFARVDAAVREAGCDCGILACTELSVFNEYHGLPDFYTDAMAVLADCCVEAFGKKKQLF